MNKGRLERKKEKKKVLPSKVPASAPRQDGQPLIAG
jgi:hypothetical protein